LVAEPIFLDNIFNKLKNVVFNYIANVQINMSFVK
jgi:hypothetical protein